LSVAKKTSYGKAAHKSEVSHKTAIIFIIETAL